MTIGVAYAAAGWMGLIVLLLVAVFGGLIVLFVLLRIPGLTGDIYGALVESIEVVILLAFTWASV